MLGVIVFSFFLVSANSALAERPLAEKARQTQEDIKGIGFSYNDLLRSIEKEQIVVANFNQNVLTVEMKSGIKKKIIYPEIEQKKLINNLIKSKASVTFDDPALASLLPPKRGSGRTVITIIVALFTILMLTIVFKMWRGSRKAKAKIKKETLIKEAQQTTVTFADIAGIDEAVEEVKELMTFLTEPETFSRLGAKMPSGVILHGPPGTGKTLLAKALAGESKTEFIEMSGSDFVEMYVGVGAKRVRELFAKAREAENGAVIFIDEVDAVAGKRSDNQSASNKEGDQTLNALLKEMDGFSQNERIVVIAATNRLDVLDSAILRPGRFSRHVQVNPPDEKGRAEILDIYAKNKPLADDVDLAKLAHITSGFSGAELAEIMNEGAIWAVRNQHNKITDSDLWEGLCRVIGGAKKHNSSMTEEERKAVAYHEAGHILGGELCPTQDKTQHATINPRGKALGFALKGATDRTMHNEQFLHENLIFILAGRAAEYVIYGTVSSGASNDLQQASLLTRQAVEEWGLSPEVGQISSQGGPLSEQTKNKVDDAVRRMVGDAYRDAVNLMKDHLVQLESLAEALLISGDINRPEIDLAMEGILPQPQKPSVSHQPEEKTIFNDQTSDLNQTKVSEPLTSKIKDKFNKAFKKKDKNTKVKL